MARKSVDCITSGYAIIWQILAYPGSIWLQPTSRLYWPDSSRAVLSVGRTHENDYDLGIQTEICRKQIQMLFQPCLWIELALLLINQQKLTPLILGTWGIELLPDLSVCMLYKVYYKFYEETWCMINHLQQNTFPIGHMSFEYQRIQKNCFKDNCCVSFGQTKTNMTRMSEDINLCGRNLAINHTSPEE